MYNALTLGSVYSIAFVTKYRWQPIQIVLIYFFCYFCSTRNSVVSGFVSVSAVISKYYDNSSMIRHVDRIGSWLWSFSSLKRQESLTISKRSINNGTCMSKHGFFIKEWIFPNTLSGEHQMHSSVLSMIGNTSNVISILSGYQAQQTSVLNDEIVMVSQGIK